LQVLVANAGSSSLKLSVIGEGAETVAAVELGDPSGSEAIDGVLAVVGSHPGIGAVGHRIVHGGPHFSSPVLVDERVRGQLDAAAAIAPLHDPPALRILDALRERTSVPQVVCFDTGFHASMPPAASTYAIPAQWREQYGVKRYGFHGISCAWSLRRASALLGRPSHELQLIVAHLGSGASVTAIRDGRSVDTSMGFTPLEGLVMATRSGTVDPGALLWLHLSRGIGVAEIGEDLEHASGTLGLAGTADMRELLGRAGGGDVAATLARDVYVHRARAVIAGMATSLDRIDAIVFTGGVGENSGEIRGAICRGLGILGVAEPDQELAAPTDGIVSGPDARIAVLVVRAREDLEIDRSVRTLIQ
jgi:acetate kinase